MEHTQARGAQPHLPVRLARALAGNAAAVALVVAAVIPALSTVEPAAADATPPVGQVITGGDAHHMTSAPLRSIHPASSGHPHPGPSGRGHGHHPASGPETDTSGSGTGTATPNIPSASNSFDGTTDLSSVIPPDNDGAAGATQYVELVNSEIAVYSKSGGLLLGPEATNTLFSGFGGGCQSNNDGDGTVLWDGIAQRWLVQQFSVTTTPYLDCVAVSSTSDATGSWHLYSFSYTSFPDYPKAGVWPDAYYVTANLFNAAGTQALGEETCAFNRASMLGGAAASSQCFMLTSSGENTVLPATIEGTAQPAAGTPEWLVGISPATANALSSWRLHIDWSNSANSSLSSRTDLPVAAFSDACNGTGTCIPQAGTSQKLDSLGDRLMFPLQYRNFGDHEALAVSHSVTAGGSVGMRWYELRPGGSALSLFQQGTYAPDSTDRWMGSMAMDGSGDMALGYSTSSSTLHPGVAYTGRLASDPAGTMPQGEATLFTGPGSQVPGPGQPANRWGDYSEMTVDPADDCTFWYVNEYLPSNGDFNWHTRIGSFKFPSCGGTVTNDFSISASPTSLTLAPNATGTSTISTAVTSGSAGTVALTVSGTPSGASASLSPTSVTAGGSSTLTVNAGSAAAGTSTLTVTGTEGAVTHSATVTLTVTSPGGGPVVSNGGFETGSLSGWTAGGVAPPSVATAQKHSGSYAAQLGASSGAEPNGDSTLTQTIAVPSGSSTLSFWYWPSTTDTITYDWQEAQIRSTSGATLAQVMKVCSNAQAWTQVTFDMSPYAGTTVQLSFNDHQDGYGDLTYMYLDDVAVAAAPVTNNFSISASPFSPASVNQGGSATSTISTAVTSGSAETVNLSASGLPSGATATFNPPSVTAGGSSTLTVATAVTTPAGTYTITVTGAAPSATHTATTSLTVVANNFSISASPTSLSVAPGGGGTSTISTALTSGAAQTINLAASGAPSGATATLNPTSVTTGGSSTLTITTAASTPTGTYTVAVTGTAPSATHATTVTLTVTNPGGGGPVVSNGGFETGSLSGWTAGGVAPPSVTTAQKHSGSYAAQLGARSGAEPNGNSTLTQTITVPSGNSTLSFWYWPSTTDTITYDWQEAQIRSTSGTTLAQVMKVCSNAHAWTQVTFSTTSYAGQTVQLYFNDHQDGYGDLTYMYLDDIAVTASAAPKSPPPSQRHEGSAW